jgi:hypothetical protein
VIIYNQQRKRRTKDMTEKIYWVDRNDITADLEETLMALFMRIPCMVDIEDIEMNWAKVTINARDEDLFTVEQYMAGLV